MKTIIFASFFFFLFHFSQAQTITYDYLSRIPTLPKDSCNAKKADVESYYQRVSAFSDEIQEQITNLNQQVKQQSKPNEAKAKQNAMNQMAQYGLSQEDMAKMQSGKMSAADKKALADKMMQQQTNMSMGEVKNMSKMSEAGKKAYAEAYGTEMMATAQSDPKQKQVNEKAKNSYEMLKEQQSVQAKISAEGQKIGKLYEAIENDPTRRQMLANIEKWQSQLTSMTGIDYGQGDKLDSLAVLIKTEKIKYCDKFTPKYWSALRQSLPLIKSSIPDQMRLSEITNEISMAQTGVSIPIESVEIGCLESVKGYVNMLKDAYKFKLYFPEEN